MKTFNCYSPQILQMGNWRRESFESVQVSKFVQSLRGSLCQRKETNSGSLYFSLALKPSPLFANLIIWCFLMLAQSKTSLKTSTPRKQLSPDLHLHWIYRSVNWMGDQ